MTDFLCLCFASRRSAEFQFDIEKFSLIMDKTGEQLKTLLEDGIHHIFEGAKVDEGETLDKEKVDKLVEEMKNEGFVFPMDVWAFDFDRSGCMSVTEFKTVLMSALNSKQDNFRTFFRGLKGTCDTAREAWIAAGLKVGWLMKKEDLEQVIAEMDKRLTVPFFKDDVATCLETYSKTKGAELMMEEFNLMWADYLTQLHLHPDRVVIKAIQNERITASAAAAELEGSNDPEATKAD